jgi:hypothetical protein
VQQESRKDMRANVFRVVLSFSKRVNLGVHIPTRTGAR